MLLDHCHKFTLTCRDFHVIVRFSCTHAFCVVKFVTTWPCSSGRDRSRGRSRGGRGSGTPKIQLIIIILIFILILLIYTMRRCLAKMSPAHGGMVTTRSSQL